MPISRFPTAPRTAAAYDVLTDPVRRLQYDSVDPTFDDAVPTKIVKNDFFKTFGPVFESNARYAPGCGDCEGLGH